MKKIMLMIVVLALSLTACAPAVATPNAQQLDEIVQATFTALTAQAPTAPPAVTTGSISGNLSFPISLRW